MSENNPRDNKPARIAGFFIYLIGAALGFALLAITVWGNIEVNTFDAALGAEERLPLDCPVMITQDETGAISATIENPTDREVQPTVRARISMGFVTLMAQDRRQVTIPAGSSAIVSWKITAEDAAYDRIVMARVYQFQNLAVPSRQGACGVVVLPFSGPTGQQVFNVGFLTSLAAVVLGVFLQRPPGRQSVLDAADRRRRTVVRSFAYLGGLFLVGTLVSTTGDWLIGAIVMLLAVVSTIAVAAHALTPR